MDSTRFIHHFTHMVIDSECSKKGQLADFSSVPRIGERCKFRKLYNAWFTTFANCASAILVTDHERLLN